MLGITSLEAQNSVFKIRKKTLNLIFLVMMVSKKMLDGLILFILKTRKKRMLILNTMKTLKTNDLDQLLN